MPAPGLGIVLDIVPNHMAASDENPFWADPELRRTFFDLDTRTGLHRRFFDIGDLAGVRVEDEAVFATTHEKALELVRDGVVDGLRIDHIDGLANPREYLDRLAREGVEHVWVEKILEPGERLRAWPVEGTTGYEFLNDVMHLFLNPRAEEPLTAPLRGAHRRVARVRRGRGGGEARAGDGDVRARAAAAVRVGRRRARTSRRRSRRSTSTARTSSPKATSSPTRTASRSRARLSRNRSSATSCSRSAGTTTSCAASSRRPAR